MTCPVPSGGTRLPRWADLVEAEPRLEQLAMKARRFPRRGVGARLDYWYKVLKPELSELVGWGAWEPDDRLLRASGAYDVAYDYLLEHCLGGWGWLHGSCDYCRAEATA
jgi:hypothetical protein